LTIKSAQHTKNSSQFSVSR